MKNKAKLSLFVIVALGSIASAEEPRTIVHVEPVEEVAEPFVPSSASLTPVNRALEKVQWYLARHLKKLNRNTGNRETEYYPMSSIAAQKEAFEKEIAQLEGYQAFLSSRGLFEARKEDHARPISLRLRQLKLLLRMAREDYNALKAKKEPNFGESQIKRAQRDAYALLERDFVKAIPKFTEDLNPQQAAEFLEAIAMGLPLTHNNNFLLGERNILGPDFVYRDLQDTIAIRATDILAKWGTKEAWAALGRVAQKSPSSLVETAAVQHLLHSDTIEKRQGLDSLPETKFLKGIRAVEAEAPLRFSRGHDYFDTSTPDNARVRFESIAANPEFGRAHAHERFVLATKVDPSMKGLAEATNNPRVPSDRWGRVPDRIREACNLGAVLKKRR